MNALAMDYNSIRSFTMTLAHRAVGDIRRGGFRQLRNYVDMCATLAKKQQQKDFFAYAQKALQRTDSCYYSLIHRLLDSVDEDRICTVGVNMGFGGLIYGASELKKQADLEGQPIAWITAARCGDERLSELVPRPPGTAALSGCRSTPSSRETPTGRSVMRTRKARASRLTHASSS